jgi:hypothetical protein
VRDVITWRAPLDGRLQVGVQVQTSPQSYLTAGYGVLGGLTCKIACDNNGRELFDIWRAPRYPPGMVLKVSMRGHPVNPRNRVLELPLHWR